MRSRILCCLPVLMFALIAAGRSAVGAPPPEVITKERAAAYQRLARAVFIERGWSVHRDLPGTLVVEHYVGLPPTFGGSVELELTDQNMQGVAQVTVTFLPKGHPDTLCDARMVWFIYGQRRGADGKYPLKGPYPFANHRAVEAVKVALDKAHQRLQGADHRSAVKAAAAKT